MDKIAVVVGSNVIFAALVREQGLNRYVVAIFPEIFPFFYPSGLREEIIKHIREITAKTSLSAKEIMIALKAILEPMTPISLDKLKKHISQAQRYTNDKDDAVFVACALAIRESYEHVILLTWNLKDYQNKELEKNRIYTVTPEEFLRTLRLKYQREEKINEISSRNTIAKLYKILISVSLEDQN
ncbi:hypothetical protein K1720_06030 [Thermococcus argininiproducens]|uniref:PIN domain-containing protein n=1 Tax=Thermococcus argininiproducens TaxID=2866384 RepID=A0A9E7M8L0_9EURY|nr:PIN domain-containing protein [Thermococcus argininiproducens]USG99105.1 hypothetical protein K1720_06030 [Thermococcus argininiproducens]